MLRETAGSISSQLCYIFRDSLDSGVIVEDSRFGHVIPLHKKGRRTIVSNYRPISLTSVCCKILESIIKDHVMKHLLKIGFFTHRQYGFLPGGSTALQLLSFMDEVTKAYD